MWFKELLQPRVRSQAGRSTAPPRPRRRLAPEQLEDRTVPADFTAATVPDLIADIHAANLLGGTNTIVLAAGTTFRLTAVDNSTHGPTGLPVIAANSNLTIVGSGDTIERSPATGTPEFRLMYVAAGASLSLQNLTLQGGSSTFGGGIASAGALALTNVTVQNNVAHGGRELVYDDMNGFSYRYVSAAQAGGVYASGPLTITGGKIQNNQAIGHTASRDWEDYSALYEGNGYVTYGHETVSFDAAGGGLFVAGGTATLSGVAITGNTARAAAGGYYSDRQTYYSTMPTAGPNESLWAGGLNGASGYGGGVYVAGGTITLSGVTLSANSALGGDGGSYRSKYPGGNGGTGYGGGLYAAAGTVTLLSSTVIGNTAAGGLAGRGRPNGKPGTGVGGGLSIAPAAVVYLDAYTVAHTTTNQASQYKNVFGVWIRW
jgi:hypothetical protein